MRDLLPPLVGAACLLVAFLLAGGAGSESARLAVGPELAPPSADHWLGTNRQGRDVFWRIMLAGGHSVAVAVPAALVALTLGGILGLFAGYLRGMTDGICLLVANAVDALPFYLWAAVLVIALHPSPAAIPIAIAGAFWTSCFRIVRAEALRLRELGYVQAARLLGVSTPQIVVRHLTPSIAYLLLAQGALLLAAALKVEVIASFVGIGSTDGLSLGVALAEASRELYQGYPWYAIGASSVLLTLVWLIHGTADRLQARWRERGEATVDS